MCVSDATAVTVNAMSWYCTENSQLLSQSDCVSMSNSICLFLGCLTCEEMATENGAAVMSPEEKLVLIKRNLQVML